MCTGDTIGNVDDEKLGRFFAGTQAPNSNTIIVPNSALAKHYHFNIISRRRFLRENHDSEICEHVRCRIFAIRLYIQNVVGVFSMVNVGTLKRDGDLLLLLFVNGFAE